MAGSRLVYVFEPWRTATGNWENGERVVHGGVKANSAKGNGARATGGEKV